VDLPLAVGIDPDRFAGFQRHGLVVDGDRRRALNKEVDFFLLLVTVIVGFATPAWLAVEDRNPELLTAQRFPEEPEAAADRLYVLVLDSRVGHRPAIHRRGESTLRR
jgi:hypothetical protein